MATLAQVLCNSESKAFKTKSNMRDSNSKQNVVVDYICVPVILLSSTNMHCLLSSFYCDVTCGDNNVFAGWKAYQQG